MKLQDLKDVIIMRHDLLIAENRKYLPDNYRQLQCAFLDKMQSVGVNYQLVISITENMELNNLILNLE